MERKDLNDTERRALSKLVGKLFDGAVIVLPDSKAGVKFLCFRMAGEVLPDVALGRPAKARETGLFISGESYVAGRVDSRTWLGTGSLDEILITLQAFGGDVRQMLNRFLHEASVRAALGVDDSVEYDLSKSPSSIPPSAPGRDHDALADAEFEGYDFGDDCRVVGHDGWESSSSGDEASFSKIVYVRFADDESGADSTKVTFNVKFKAGEVDEVYALEHRHGNEIGQRRQPHQERPRG